MVFNKLHNIFSQGNSKIRVCLHPALTPGPVQNLTATVDTCKPSVTLNWDPPANAKHILSFVMILPVANQPKMVYVKSVL